MRGRLSVLVVGTVFAVASGAARAQEGLPDPYRYHGYYAAPGLYGTTFGSASYGLKRTYSEFSSPYGAGYGYGYAPSTLLPGPYGAGLWQPGPAPREYFHGDTARYRTFAVPESVSGVRPLPPPPLGVYAPGLGPGVFYSWMFEFRE